MRQKLFLAILLLAATGIMASAQIKFGAKAGFTSSKLSLKEIDTKTINAYHVGAVAQLDLPFGFAVQSGVLYQVKGVSIDASIFSSSYPDTSTGYAKTKYQFVEIPIQAQWGIDLILLRPFVLGEFYWGYSLNNNNPKEHGFAYGFGIDVSRFQLSAKYFRNHDKMKGIQVSLAVFL